ncbi:lipid II flippase Amj family protein [Clostridium thermarum]|uniref:lipid II flippase Amj family protein n=1 Tax=Clostridium thermarum TaxID=1716543 RepID=UPI0013CF6D9C|nr:lipid II flippase Amj family protein [Clostridium thermarum]
MSTQVIIVLILTFIIYVISTLAYSVRIVGVKTGRIAISFAVFNVFALISRTANTLLSPLLSKNIERSIEAGSSQGPLGMFRWILFSATIATIAGAVLMPTFIKVFGKAVANFSIYRSIPKLLVHGFSKAGIEQFKNSITKPKRDNIEQLKSLKRIPNKIIVLNTIAFSISTVAPLAALYAGFLNPSMRITCSSLAPVINGMSTILMFIFIDPYISMLTDDVIRGECEELQFHRCIIFIVAGLIAGTIIAQFLLVPAAKIIEFVASVI